MPVKADGSLLGRAYHRALLEIVSALYPQWQVQCNDLGHLSFAGPTVGRAQGEQFGMLAIFPDTQALAVHLNADLGQIARTSEGQPDPRLPFLSGTDPRWVAGASFEIQTSETVVTAQSQLIAMAE